MLAPTTATIRIFLHVIAATVWVGGQIVLAGLVPGLRRAAPEAPRFAARRFNLLAWPAFVVLVVTGVWNLFAVDIGDTTLAYQVTLGVKVALVALAGVAAAIHSVTTSKVALAAGGAAAALGSIGALFLGVLLGTGS